MRKGHLVTFRTLCNEEEDSIEHTLVVNNVKRDATFKSDRGTQRRGIVIEDDSFAQSI